MYLHFGDEELSDRCRNPTYPPLIYIPGTQMTLVLIGKYPVLEGSTTKIEDKLVPGI